MPNYFHNCKTQDEAKKEYRKQSMLLHPDKPGGSTVAFQELNTQYETFKKTGSSPFSWDQGDYLQDTLNRFRKRAEEMFGKTNSDKPREGWNFGGRSFWSGDPFTNPFDDPHIFSQWKSRYDMRDPFTKLLDFLNHPDAPEDYIIYLAKNAGYNLNIYPPSVRYIKMWVEAEKFRREEEHDFYFLFNELDRQNREGGAERTILAALRAGFPFDDALSAGNGAILIKIKSWYQNKKTNREEIIEPTEDEYYFAFLKDATKVSKNGVDYFIDQVKYATREREENNMLHSKAILDYKAFFINVRGERQSVNFIFSIYDMARVLNSVRQFILIECIKNTTGIFFTFRSKGKDVKIKFK